MVRTCIPCSQTGGLETTGGEPGLATENTLSSGHFEMAGVQSSPCEKKEISWREP
jgi:hypothetical protein